MIKIIEADTDELVAEAKELFQEYAETLGFDLCFQNFDVEMENFPSMYSPPKGRLFLAISQDQPVGCVGLRYFEKGICEMKRLYVRPDCRGEDTGRKLAQAAIEAAKEIGYSCMRIDTLPSMERANKLYKTLGFRETGPYRHNPIEGAIYLELNLND